MNNALIITKTKSSPTTKQILFLLVLALACSLQAAATSLGTGFTFQGSSTIMDSPPTANTSLNSSSSTR